MTSLETARERVLPLVSPGLYSKWDTLLAHLRSLESAAVAYSGGVDSGFLAHAAFLELGGRMVAVTIQSPLELPGQAELAARFAAEIGFEHRLLPFDPLQEPLIRSNPADRCYHCKRAILRMIRLYADRNQLKHVLEGQNTDDQDVYRPGKQAILESGTLSPLLETGLTKAEIRDLAKALGLSIWEQPSSPCLATRFPYGTPLTAKGLQQVASGESFLRARGFHTLRLRHYNELARIEIPPEQFPQFIALREQIVSYFKQIGFLYITLDLQGFRSGSMDEGLDDQ